MYATSFLVPADQLTLTDQRTYKQKAIDQGIGRMLKLNLVTTEDDLVVRAIRAYDDFGLGTINENEWGVTLAAGNNAGLINLAARPANQIVVLFGLDDFDAAPQATLVTFGTAAVGGTTKMVVDLQVCRSWLNSAGFLSEPVVYDPQQVLYVSVQADAAHDPEYLMWLGYIIEPRSGVIS